MATKTRKQLADEIDELCDQAGCNDKIRQVHSKQYVDKHWNPHPPRAFLSWWNQDGPQLTKDATGRDWALVDAVRAFNCEAVQETAMQSEGISKRKTTGFATLNSNERLLERST